MTLTASHRDLDLDVLEQLSSGAHSVGSEVVADSHEITGCVVLATCNRFEVYLDVAETCAGPETALDAVTATVARTSGLPQADVQDSLQARVGPEVGRHLFAVASGLDSMVIGEREVAGQVRRALHTARTERTTSPRLERLFQTASRTSRAVGAQTGLGGTGRSVVGVALDLAAEALVESDLELAQARVLLVGTGSYAGASVTALRARGVTDVAVHSPSGRAAGFAAERGLEAVEPGTLDAQLARADVVLSCSGALGPVVDAAMVVDARRRSVDDDGRPRPVVLIDLALHHDIDPQAAQVPGVHLIDLATVQQHSPTTVSPAVEAGLEIVARSAAEFEAGLAEQELVPEVVALRARVEAQVAAEVARVAARQGPEAAAQVERSLRRVSAALLHQPTVRAREHARAGRAEEYRDGLAAVFGIEPEGPATDGPAPDGPV
ncbi:glutamyl-tRNA reductase [Actinotalea soli]|nr:glutamyl-tRNA reductase [Actinotalea soli]